KSKRTGFTIPLVMCVIILVLIMGNGLLSLGQHRRTFGVLTCSGISARSAADAGVTKALFEMNRKLKVKPWDNSILPQATDEILPNTGATYSYKVTANPGSGYAVESIGRSGLEQNIIQCTLVLKGPFEHALLTKKDLVLKSDTLVQGYNSGDPLDTDIEVIVATQSTVPGAMILNNGVGVDGDVAVGAGGSVDTVIKDLGASMHKKYAMLQNVDLPVPTPPALESKGSITLQGKTSTIGPGDSGQYSMIDVKRATNPGILEVSGGDVVLYVTGNLGLGQDCEIIIKEGASLTLYLDGDMIADNSAGINNENDPSSLKLYGTSTGEQSLILKAKSDILGAIYAPNANITVMAKTDIRGSLIAKSFELKNGGDFYYDEALRKVTTEDDVVHFVIIKWSEQ
ncbi:MAG: collagen-binding domain-containing protein, partial [Sedimentisphaerales bacterium]